MYQIYKITNKINNKSYIGSTNNIKRRWRQHKEASIYESNHAYNYPLMKAFRKDGIDNFTFEIIESCNNYQEMIEHEYNWIIKLNCIYPNGYNQTSHTDSPMFDPNISQKMSQTKREKYGKTVCEIDKNNNIIKQWNSIIEASEDTGLNRFKISDVCNGRRLTTGERRFRFLINNKIFEPKKQINKTKNNRITSSSKKVEQIKDGIVIKTYNSIAIAAKENNCDASGISKVCNGKRKHCGGYEWRYKTNN